MLCGSIIKKFYIYLQSQQTAQKYLYHCYQKIETANAEMKSYENANHFLYLLEHGLTFYNNGKTTDTVLQPMLLFYGMSHLLKAAILTRRPDYPESTKVLAHGLSTRKRKKKDYSFMQDEVRVQHHGLFPYVSEHLFHIPSATFDKFKMIELLALIPEVTHLFSFNQQKMLVEVGKIGEKSLHFPYELLDDYHLTQNAFIYRFKENLPNILYVKEDMGHFQLDIDKPIESSSAPFLFHLEKGSIYFPKRRNIPIPISEIMVHYILLYNLSMISRYETEWWGDLIHSRPDQDYPFIKQFLNVTAWKIPLLIGEFIYPTSE